MSIPTISANVDNSSLDADETMNYNYSPLNNDTIRSRRTIWKNIIMIIVCYALVAMGMTPMNSIRSSLNADKNLGVWTMAASNIASIFMLTSAMLIVTIGIKKVAMLYEVATMLYIGASFAPSFATMIPAGTIYGIFSSVGFVAYDAYIACLASEYAENFREDFVRVQGRFFSTSIFFSALTAVLANIISSLILGYNVTQQNITDDQLAMCGVDYCNQDLGSDFDPNANSTTPASTDKAHVYTLCAFCLLFVIIAFILTFFLGEAKKSELSTGVASQLSPFFKTMRHLVTPKQLLLVFPTLVDAIGWSFWSTDFSKGYVTCADGIQYIGYIMTCYSLVSGVAAPVLGWFSKRKSRIVTLVTIYILKLAILITLLFWKPTTDSWASMFSITAVWGLTAGGGSLISALYGDTFRSNLAEGFTGKHVYSIIGYIVIDVASALLCMSYRLYLHIGYVCLAFICYVTLERVLVTENRKSAD